MINIGVIGAGHLGKIHIKLLKEIEEANLIGFYDIDKENAQEVVHKFGIKSYSSLEELILDSDALDIVTPTTTHFDIAKLALKHLKHIFIEKPITASVKEARELLNLSYEAGVKVQVGHVERFNPAFLAIKSYLDTPMFIEIHRLAQYNPRGTDVSVVYDLMIHDIDIVLKVISSKIKKISPVGVNVLSDSIDIANARIEFHNGAVANLTASRISLKKMRKMRVFQNNAYISADFLEKKVEIVKMKPVEKEDNPFGIYIDTPKGKKQIYYMHPDITENNAIKDELSEFCKSIINETTPPVTIEEGFMALQVAEEIDEKIRNSLEQ